MKRKDCIKPKPADPQKCTACAGSGYYDQDGSPPCVACAGTGVESPRRYSPFNEP